MSGVENWASIRGRSRLRVVAELGCRVCEGKQLVVLGPVGAPELAAVTPCPACVAGVPIHPLSYRTEPRSA